MAAEKAPTTTGQPYDRVFNFSAGPAVLPLEVLEQAQADLLNWRGSGAPSCWAGLQFGCGAGHTAALPGGGPLEEAAGAGGSACSACPLADTGFTL